MSVDITIDEKTLERAFNRLAKMPEEVRDNAKRQIKSDAKKVKKTVKNAVNVRNGKPITRQHKAGEATYYPGNLQKSISYLDRRLKGVGELVRVIGPKFRKSGHAGDFGKTSRTNPYYWHAYLAHTAGSSGGDPFKTAHNQHAASIMRNLEKIVFKAVDNVNKGT